MRRKTGISTNFVSSIYMIKAAVHASRRHHVESGCESLQVGNVGQFIF